jgi:hypothetical protein
VQDNYFYLFGSIDTIIKFAILSFLFWKIIVSKGGKRIIWGINTAFGAYLIYFFITVSHDSFDSVPSGITSLILLVYSIYYLFECMKNPIPLDISSSPVFWVVVSIIIYSAGTFFPFIYARNYMKEIDFENMYQLIHSPLYIIKNIIFSIAIMIKPISEKKYAASVISKNT